MSWNYIMKNCRPIGVALALAMLVLALPGCKQHEATATVSDQAADAIIEVPIAPVTRHPMATKLELVGTLIPVRATTVVSDVDGIIQSFPLSNRRLDFSTNDSSGTGRTESVTLGLDLGHKVRQGEVLVQIDPVDFQLNLQVAEANLEMAKRNLDDLLAWRRPEEVEQTRGAYEEAAASYQRALADLRRSEQLLSKRAISQGEYDGSLMAERTAAAAVKQAQAALKLAEAGPTRQQIAVAEAQVKTAQAEVAIRQEKLDKTTIHAPYDAVIADRYVDVGDRVTAMPRVEIMQIIDPRVLFAQIDVPERYQGHIRLDDTAEITAAGIAQPFPGRVDLINSKIDTETRTFRVRVTIDNRRELLKAGGFVHVQLPIAAATNVLAVSNEAVSFVDGRPSVFVFQDGIVRRRSVQLGMADHDSYEITAGLEPNELIVTGKTSLLADGLPVRASRPDDAPRNETPSVKQ